MHTVNCPLDISQSFIVNECKLNDVDKYKEDAMRDLYNPNSEHDKQNGSAAGWVAAAVALVILAGLLYWYFVWSNGAPAPQ